MKLTEGNRRSFKPLSGNTRPMVSPPAPTKQMSYYSEEVKPKTRPYSFPLAYSHVLMFDSSIDSPDEYAEFSDILIGATENDVVNIYFSTGGGDGGTMVQTLNLMAQCKAHIIGHLISEASSAGSFLLLHCDEIFVGEYTEMLCHTVKYGVYGDHPSVQSQVNHTGSLTEKMIRGTYKYFLTEEEIEDVLKNNRQLFLDSDEICRRLEIRQQMYAQEQIEAQKQASADMEAMFDELDHPVPEAILKKLNKSQLIDYIAGKVDIIVNEDGTFELETLEDIEIID
jgi:ATP-dependent protease ClpP protease subunit